MRRFEYQLLVGQQLTFDFSGDEEAKLHIEVDSGQVLFTTVIDGRKQEVVIPEGRSWISGTNLRRGIQKVTIERDPAGGAAEPVVTFDIGADAGTPGAATNITIDQIKQGPLTDRGVAITSGGAAEVVAAANTGRRYLLLVNRDVAETCYVNLSGTAVDDETSIEVGAGVSVVWEGTFIPTGAVSVLAATTAHEIACWEG